MQLTEEQIAEHLRENLHFFDRHTELLANMRLPNPHGSGIISLAERQLLAQRDKARVLEAKLDRFVALAKENDLISDKVHQLSLHLLGAKSFDELTQGLLHNLRESFSVPYVGIRLWAEATQTAELAQTATAHTQAVFQPADEDLKNWLISLKAPYCGLKPDLALDNLFEKLTSESTPPKSFAILALGGSHSLGLLVLASDDDKRFYPEMGTLYLKRIGEMVSTALSHYLD
ncbi:MAG: DUF484 family protein [Methylophilaceae bacterium]|nr:DUF484 family protein [Methylophilaceae bacterium]